jgi:hypothetical protein
MSEQTEQGKITFTVIFPTGHEISHVYDAPMNELQVYEFISAKIKMIAEGLSEQGVTLLVFENPLAAYNARNVAGVRFTSISPERLKAIKEQLERKAGFVTDKGC